MLCVVWESRLEMVLEVFRRQSCPVLKITLSGGNEILIEVIDVLAIIIFTATSADRDSLGPPTWPPLIAFDALFVPLSVACNTHFLQE
jgi:hypothetical protein